MKHDFLTQPHTHLRTPREASRDFRPPQESENIGDAGDRLVGLGMAACAGALAALLLAGVI